MVAEAVAVCPTASVAVPVIVWFAPSVLIVCGPGQLTGVAPPEHENVTVTGVLFQPAALAAGDATAVTTSGGKGCSVNVRLVLVELPALSTAVPLIVCNPVVVTFTGAGQVATPDRASEQVKLTVAVVALMIPFAFGTGETVAVIAGGVLSILTVAVVLALFPALSLAVPDAVWPAPSAVSTAGAVQVATPDSASAQTKFTVTSVLFQPKALAAGTRLDEIVGGVKSIFRVTDAEAELPARSTALPVMT